MASLRRLRRRLASEEGSFLIEALVTASILLVVAAGVTLALQTAHAQSGLQRTKAIATDVAQNKLDELRSRQYNELRALLYTPESIPVEEGGQVFNVVSTLSTVPQTGAPSGCNNQRARDYMSIKTTVTWTKMGGRKPVVLDTLVAAPVGVGGGLVVTVTGGAGQGVGNIPLSLKAGAGTASTDASGCARWDAVSAGTGYSLEASVPGYVQPNGVQDVVVNPISIVAEETAQASIAYDRGGSVNVTFRQRTPGSSAYSAVANPSSMKAISLSNASATVTKPVVNTTGTTGASGLYYPFPSAYAVYADVCSAAKPATTPSVTIPAGGAVPATVDLPSLDVKVANSGGIPTDTVVRVKTACGTVYEGLAVNTTGTYAGLLVNPGLPYGDDFQVCASSASTGRRVRATVDNKTYGAPTGAAGTLTMAGNSSTNACWF
jgi:hypothetical protein